MNKRPIACCRECKRKLLVNPQNGLCLMCENTCLRAKIGELELALVQARREKQALYAKLSAVRAEAVK